MNERQPTLSMTFRGMLRPRSRWGPSIFRIEAEEDGDVFFPDDESVAELWRQYCPEARGALTVLRSGISHLDVSVPRGTSSMMRHDFLEILAWYSLLSYQTEEELYLEMRTRIKALPSR